MIRLARPLIEHHVYTESRRTFHSTGIHYLLRQLTHPRRVQMLNLLQWPSKGYVHLRHWLKRKAITCNSCLFGEYRDVLLVDVWYYYRGSRRWRFSCSLFS